MDTMFQDDREKKSTNEQRSTKLIADFRNGFVEGWVMLVPEAFREALDIKMTSRMSGGTKEQMWTQGTRYNFRTNDLLYSACPDVYTKQWSEGITSVNFSVSILAASPASGGMNGEKRRPGFVRAEFFLPSGPRLIPAEIIDTTQDEFVRFLKTGFMCHATDGIPENVHEYFVRKKLSHENNN